ncbi:MAG: cupin domain-containing protein [Chloroflexi bacterium]|nr:cupin domain-containing protein [Chloroflexota bacterium]
MQAPTVSHIGSMVLENERVKVYEFLLQPGEITGTHSHPDYVAYCLSGSSLRMTSPDGKTRELAFKTGETSFRKALTHSIENTGREPARFLVIELK